MSQSITPELRQWIVAQAEAGFTPQVILESMCASGWTEDVAVQAMEDTLRQHLDGIAQSQGLPPAVPVPEPDIGDAPLYIDTRDRRVHVLQAMAHPRVVVFGNLLSDEECEALIALAEPRMARSLTVATQTGGEEINQDRTSSGMFFQRGETALITTIEARIAELLRWPLENGEGLQVLHYQSGAEYKPHYDYFDPDAPGTPSILKRGG